MFFYYLQIFSSIIALIVNILFQIIVFAVIKKTGLLRSMFLGFIFGFISIVMLELSIFSVRIMPNKDFLCYFICNIIIYLSLSYCYFHFVNMGETARRIRILRELYDSPGGLLMEEILERYNTKEIIDKRLERLLNNKQIIIKNDRYFSTKSSMSWITNFMVIMKILLFNKQS